ncbi:MerR family transcriptional regulator [Actinotalea ferrariae CF5-4]|uniref:MerR family transcriptional regulator n=1 Tax=Actinotalea ferrariae CF5-4 TaxID=948458 RepID=A0A021VU75_9CELL|nr:MerR family transcriptional regulator [Actinotalea ferrariae]EYR64706.1 MerR family transcriptional regulator [Actinotalea ferrariae CF5-4]
MARSGSSRADDDAPGHRDHGPTLRTASATPTRGADTDVASTGPSLTVAAVARRLGVAPATLRTWDRRYGLGPSEHLAGAHRRYSSADVARLLVMRRLTLEGVAPAEAARAALAADPSPVQGGDAVAAPSITEVVDAYAHATPMAPDPPALVAAAGHFDNAAVRWMLSRVHPRDPLAWWTDLVDPALRTLEGRVTLEGPGEHAAPALMAAAFAELRSRGAVSAARSADGDGAPPAVVLALTTARSSDLLVHVVATALQERGVRARVLSTTAPRAAVEALTRVRPAAVLVHVGGQDADPVLAVEVVRVLVEADETVPVFVQGDASSTLDLPVAANVHRVRTLPGTLHEVVAAVR